MTADEALLERVRAADVVHGPSITDAATTSHEDLPWYRRFRLLEVLLRLPHKPIVIRYADDGQEIVLLGSSYAIYGVNAREGLRLGAEHVSRYLRFFFANSEMARTQIVESPDEPMWLRHASEEPEMAQLKQVAQSLIRPMHVVPAGEGGYRVIITAIQDRRLLNMVLDVQADGRVSELSRSVLLENIPVPYLGI